MEIKLTLNDKEQVFMAPRPKGRTIREAAALMEETDLNKITASVIDQIIDFVVAAFGGQFTRDDVYDGLYADELMPTILEIVNKLVSGTTDRLEPKNA